MKNVPLYILMAILHVGCSGQNPKKEITNKDFKWKIVIPEGFDTIPAQEWSKLQEKGKDAIEQTYDAEIENNAKMIFVFKSGEGNSFESNYQPFDSATDGNYIEAFSDIKSVLFETFKAQMPYINIDTLSSQESIDGLVFQTFKINLSLTNKMEMEFFMFTRLFDKRALTVNIMYADKNKGKNLLDAWRNSKFDKQ